MSFLSEENHVMLSEIVKDNITTDMVLFDNLYNDFGSRESGPLMSLNKKFLTIIRDISISMKPRKVTFEQQVETQRQNFLSYTPTPPNTPVFSDTISPDPPRKLEDIVKDAMVSRKYDTTPVEVKSDVPKRLNIQPIDSDVLSTSAIVISTDQEPSDTIIDLLTKLENRLNFIEIELKDIKRMCTTQK